MLKEAYPNLTKLAKFDTESVLKFLGDNKHMLIPGAIGAAAGGLGGAGLSAMQPEEDRSTLRNVLLGLLMGGGAGAGLGYVKPNLVNDTQAAIVDAQEAISEYNPFKKRLPDFFGRGEDPFDPQFDPK
jgi:hypothetical protein